MCWYLPSPTSTAVAADQQIDSIDIKNQGLILYYLRIVYSFSLADLPRYIEKYLYSQSMRENVREKPKSGLCALNFMRSKVA